MVIPAIAELRALAPSAAIDLVVGSWNREIAATIAHKRVPVVQTHDDRPNAPRSQLN